MNEVLMEEIQPEEIHRLLETFAKKSYTVNYEDQYDTVTSKKCLSLFRKDYWITVVDNTDGGLCGHYPSQIPLLEYEKSEDNAERRESRYDASKMKTLFKESRFARCRSRFVVPVILYKGKHVCRSATLATGLEMVGRSVSGYIYSKAVEWLEYAFSSKLTESSSKLTESLSKSTESLSKSTESPSKSSASPSKLTESLSKSSALPSILYTVMNVSDLQLFADLQQYDINVLKCFDVQYIVDLMVEKNKVKLFLKVSSSEKVNIEKRYHDFCIVSVPYPGCEFFKEWKVAGCNGKAITFNWNMTGVDASLVVPPIEPFNQLMIDWSIYKKWNLIELTQNYMKMILHVLKEGDKGILIHCISGWDRTPMFVSLIRLSLWADGVIHRSLSAVEIVYLTLAYDWYLFGHILSDRLAKKEEIMLFCFDFLTYMQADEYSVRPQHSCTSIHTPNESVNLNKSVSPTESVTPKDSPKKSVTPKDSPKKSVTPKDHPNESVTLKESVTPKENVISKESVTPNDSLEESVTPKDSPKESVCPKESVSPQESFSPKETTKMPDVQRQQKDNGDTGCTVQPGTLSIGFDAAVMEPNQTCLVIGCDDEHVAALSSPSRSESSTEWYSVSEQGSLQDMSVSGKWSSGPVLVTCGVDKQLTITYHDSWQIISNVGSIPTDSPKPSVAPSTSQSSFSRDQQLAQSPCEHRNY